MNQLLSAFLPDELGLTELLGQEGAILRGQEVSQLLGFVH